MVKSEQYVIGNNINNNNQQGYWQMPFLKMFVKVIDIYSSGFPEEHVTIVKLLMYCINSLITLFNSHICKQSMF